jgi:hypothetical protein
MRLTFTAMLFAALSLPAQAFDWPWQEEREVRYGYCKGFVVAGLAEGPVLDLSRTNLWLAWNSINRAELPEGSITVEDYESGRSGFSELLAAGNRDSLLEVADGECGLGRN